MFRSKESIDLLGVATLMGNHPQSQCQELCGKNPQYSGCSLRLDSA
jgi:hypothetical protein